MGQTSSRRKWTQHDFQSHLRPLDSQVQEKRATPGYMYRREGKTAENSPKKAKCLTKLGNWHGKQKVKKQKIQSRDTAQHK